MRLVFMGTPAFAVPSLEALTAAGHQVAAVVTQPDRPRGRGKKPAPPPVKEAAQVLGLPVWQTERVREAGFVARLAGLQPEAIVVVAFGQILPREILLLPPAGCINVHASLLPRYRGAAPIHRAVINGEKETGVTTMFMDEGLDTGDIILQAALPIGPDDNVGVVHDRLARLGSELLVRTLELVAAGQAPRTPQDQALATYAPPLRPEDEVIDWTRPAAAIKNLVRGLDPWPGARTTLDGRVLKIWRVRVAEITRPDAVPGEIVAADPAVGILVRAGDGIVVVEELQMAGGKRLDGRAFLRGHRLQVGAVCGR
ncbi:MAG: methionyl-tRNA formyltransferase [Bacillota bacterium]